MAWSSLRVGWNWFVDGLAEGLLWARDRWARVPAFRVEIVDGAGRIIGSDGSAMVQIVSSGSKVLLEPPDIARHLTGAAFDIYIPPSFLFRRDLDPIAAQSAPYLDAFVRHQIDKITPWRVADVHYKIVHAPLPSDPTRLSVGIGVVPKRLVQSGIDGLLTLNPRRIRLVARQSPSDPEYIFPVSDQSRERMLPLRRWVQIVIVTLGLGLASGIGWTWWEAEAIRGEIADQDQVIQERNSVFAAARRREQAGKKTEDALKALRASRPKVADILDALSAALPDSAYLTALNFQKEQIVISGVTRSLPQLVPALEAPGRFKDAAFTAPTTKLESADGDRFHLQMRASVPGEGTAPP